MLKTRYFSLYTANND